MKFWEAAKLVLEGKKIRKVNWGKDDWISQQEDEGGETSFELTIHWEKDEWELYQEPVQMENIMPITPPALPFDTDAKIFRKFHCEEDECDCPIEYESMDDQIKTLRDISGVSHELLGPREK